MAADLQSAHHGSTKTRAAFASLAVAAALLFGGAPAGAQTQSQTIQPAQPLPQRARASLQLANEAYSRGEYEKAAKLCAHADSLKRELTEGERSDLEALRKRNNVAVQGRRDGKELLNNAERALKQKRTADAAGFLTKAKANQYLAGEDQIRLNRLYDSMRVPTVKTVPMGPVTAQSLLADARMALKAGDLETAKNLALQAKALEPRIMGFWNRGDRAAYVLHDVEVERIRRQKMMQTPPDAQPKKSNNPFSGLKGFFKLPGQGDTPQNNPPSAPATGGTGTPNKVSANTTSPYNSVGDKSSLQTVGVQSVTPAGSDQPISVVSKSAPARPSGDPAANTQQARQFIKQGYQALQSGEYDNARKFARQAQDLHPDLEWWEMNPEKLLTDIQRRSGGTTTAGVGTATQPSATSTTANTRDPHALLRQARALYSQKKLDEAEQLCVQAAGVSSVHWGLFEDSPEKLRVDIQRSRGSHNRDEAARLLAEARKLYNQGNYQEAKAKAWRAQQLHGPYNIWDLGDRPQRVLADIERAERKAGPAKQNSGQAGATDSRTPLANTPSRPDAGTQPNNSIADKAARDKAIKLMTESRDLQRRGMFVEARERALAARQLNIEFSAQGDSPDLVLQDLNLNCSKHIDAYLKRADETMARFADSDRFQKAASDLSAARALALTFGQDTNRVDVRIGWLRQAQASAGVAPPPVQQTAAAPGSGADLLDKARRELKAGNNSGARQLAIMAFDAKYGVQQEATALLRSIDIEEHNQQILAAHRNADAALAAFSRQDYRTARAILAGVDPHLLNANMQQVVREMAARPEMQPGGIAVVKNETPVQPNSARPGKAVAEDLGPAPGDSALSDFQAMEAVIYEKLLTDSREAQRKAIKLVQDGEVSQAIDLLRDHLEQLNHSQLDPAKVSLLRNQVDTRLQQYRTLQARATIDRAQETQFYGKPHNEGEYQGKIRKTQDEVADLLKQYREFMKQGKYDDARLAALKAKEMDPDNVAATAAIQIAATQNRLKELDNIKGRNEDMFLRALDGDVGPYVSAERPLAIDKEALKRVDKRLSSSEIWPKTRNATERDIERKLSIPRSVNFKDQKLRTIIEDLHSLSGINIVPDEEALREQNISLDMLMSLSVENISMKNIMELLLKKAHLTYVIRNEVLNITTENNAKGRLKQVTYSVADLVVPVEEAPEEASLDRVLDDYRARMMNGVSTANTPFLGQYALPNGATVSQSGSSAASLAAAQSPGVNTQSLVGQRSKRGTIEELLIDLITKTVAPDTWDNAGGAGRIQYFPLGMALVINQTQDVQEQIQDLLAALRRLQDLEVAVELRMVSVSEAFFERMGVDFSVNLLTHNNQADKNELVNSSFQPFGLPNSFQPGRFVSGMTPAGTFTPDLNIPVKTGSFGLAIPPFGNYPGTLTQDGGISLGLAFLSDIQVYMFMEAAQGDRRINVMQAPKVTVFNGQTAFLTVRLQQFFMVSITPSFTPFGNLIFTPNNIPFPLGVTLRVTPVISADRRFVRLNMVPTMTNLVDATVPLFPVQFPVPLSLFGPGNFNTQGPPEGLFQMFFQQPTFTTISVLTTVNVPDGGTVLLGGLKTLNEGRNEYGPPILSKIPYINRLFKNVGYGREAQSLMLMVTPRIIINEEEEQIFRGVIEPIPRP